LEKFSEQQFVDCDTNCGGCNGGLEWLAFEYAMRNPIAFEKDYPYAAKNNNCVASTTQG